MCDHDMCFLRTILVKQHNFNISNSQGLFKQLSNLFFFSFLKLTILSQGVGHGNFCPELKERTGVAAKLKMAHGSWREIWKWRRSVYDLF